MNSKNLSPSKKLSVAISLYQITDSAPIYQSLALKITEALCAQVDCHIFGSEDDCEFLNKKLSPSCANQVKCFFSPALALREYSSCVSGFVFPLGRMRPGVVPNPSVLIYLGDNDESYFSGHHRRKRLIPWGEMQEGGARASKILTDCQPLQALLINALNRNSRDVVVLDKGSDASSWTQKIIAAFQNPDVVEIESTDESVRFSIVTPSFNQAHYIQRTIDSVLSQGYKNFEYWVVDGGSTDGTVDILKNYGPRIKWTSEKDKGYASAVNKGFSQATGDYLMWLASDDTFCGPDALATMAMAIKKSRMAEVVYGDALYIDREDRVLDSYRTAPYSFESLKDWCLLCQPATAFAKSVFLEVGGLNENLRSIADYDLWLRFAEKKARFYRVGKPIALYRLHTDSITITQRLKTFREIFDLQLSKYGRVGPSWVRGALGEIRSKFNRRISRDGPGELIDLEMPKTRLQLVVRDVRRFLTPKNLVKWTWFQFCIKVILRLLGGRTRGPRAQSNTLVDAMINSGT